MIRLPKESEEILSSINTTPLVDVMLVLLIIFLLTIPVAVQQHEIHLPKESSQPRLTKPEDINIFVTKNGNIFWNDKEINQEQDLLKKLKSVSLIRPQPEVHIRADEDLEYQKIAKILLNCQKAGIVNIGFLTEPPPKG